MIRLALCAVLTLGVASVMQAQVRRAPPIVRRDTLVQKRDTTAAGRDTTRAGAASKDTTAAPRQLIEWAEADSVMQALMKREGYTATRYQGDTAIFDARTHNLELKGVKSGVNREQTVLVGKTITYSDSTKIIIARGDTVILRDPEQQAADVIARGQMVYSVALRRGCVTNISTSVESGEKWFVEGANACFVSQPVFVPDTSRGRETAFYARNASLTSCDDSIPDYHFQAKQIKMVSKNIMVARPAVLYIGDVPILWLPFIFQDMRSGRRSGILTPRFGVTELFRNSPTYRREVDNLGYYFALSDYMDAQIAMDWRSGSRPTEGDPGWVRFNGELQYRWLDRFMTGRVGLFHHSQRDGTTNTGLSWYHSQDFSQDTHLHTNINYVTNTSIQRTTTFNPMQVLASISSNIDYATKIGPASLDIGGQNTQHPGRKTVDRTFPVFSITSPTIAVTSWLDWTPTFNYTTSQQLNSDQAGDFTYRFFTNARGEPDSVALKRNARQTSSSFNTPIRIGGFTWSNSFKMTDNEIDAPQNFIVRDPNDSSKRTNRIFAKTFDTDVDWQTSFTLPSIGHNSLNLVPSFSIVNVDGSHGFWVRSHLNGGRFVTQSKRISTGLSASPTLFGLFPGFGPVTRFRHSITPQLTWTYAPSGKLSDEFLQATNRSRQSYLGTLAQNSLTLTVSQVLEAKLRSSDTSSTAEPKKVRVLSTDFSALSWDFERARKTHRSGFNSSNFSANFTSDLIPGFRSGIQWSLYQGDILSDSAVFKPFRTGINASLTLNSQSGIFGVFNRLFGRAAPPAHPQVESVEPSPDDALASRVAATPIAGVTSRNRQFSMPATQGWSTTLTYSSSRQRPPTGSGNIIDENFFATQCAAAIANPILYQQCIDLARTNLANTKSPLQSGIGGGTFIRTPPQDNLQASTSFHLTPKWSGTWNTNYDFTARKFGMHTVTLQRELHDWRAIFGFTQAPNGNFAFTFFIALNAEPDLKFNYDKQTYRPVAR
ncbi:MAG TPA: putative LPS assembly protein LptD [Gemmatimonadaceae bacterium]|nr:putative LPS assembly protein LptD [Gemmatimonadaceae bacterium]